MQGNADDIWWYIGSWFRFGVVIGDGLYYVQW